MGTLITCKNCDIKEESTSNIIQCDVCGDNFHLKCVKLNQTAAAEILSYHCKLCEKKKGPSIFKRKLKRSKVNIDYVALNDGDSFAIDKSIHPHVHKFHEFPVDANKIDKDNNPYIEVLHDLTFEHATKTHLKKPILIPSEFKKDVGMRLPCDKDLITIDYILDKVGDDKPVEVMDVLSQQGVSPGWNMKQWRDYFLNKDSRDRIRNVISLEISDVKGLGKDFHRPYMVRSLDLVDKIWDDVNERPQVTKYCLMSVGGSFTDFHIDFGGTSVYYTVLSGAKTFLMFPPTKQNLELYTQWCLEQDQNYIWYPEYLKGKLFPKDGFKVTLSPGDVFIIPSGWIHCVHTPIDSLVIGGNFLTMMNMKKQLDIYNIEKKTGVPMKFRHPQFNKVIWLTSWYYLNNKSEFFNDIGPIDPNNDNEADDGYNGKTILKVILEHLKSHYELSKTSQIAKKSIPIKLIGKDIPNYLSKFQEWCTEACDL